MIRWNIFIKFDDAVHSNFFTVTDGSVQHVSPIQCGVYVYLIFFGNLIERFVVKLAPIDLSHVARYLYVQLKIKFDVTNGFLPHS